MPAIVTHPRIFNVPTPLSEAVAFVAGLAEQPTCVPVGAGHATVATRDRGFARFTAVR